MENLKTSHRLPFTPVPVSQPGSSNYQPITSVQSTSNFQPTPILQPIVSTSSNIASFFTNEQVMDAEILWAMKTIKSHYSYNSCEAINKLFTRMFPDSLLAKQFACGPTKCAYLCCFGLAPYFKSLIYANLADVDFYTLLFDETLNKCTQTKQMDIHVRYWNVQSGAVETKYLTSAFLGHSRSEDMLSAFLKSVSKIDLSKLLHVSMDGPNVNWKFYDLLHDEIKKEFGRDIVCIGSCGLHIMNNSFKHGASSTDWNISGILSSLFWLFKDSPVRTAEYEKVSELKKMPLMYCGYRWLENVPVLERAIEIWPDIKKYIQISKLNIRSYHIIATAVKDELILVKLNFFLAVSKLLLPFLEIYQNDKPLVPFFASDTLKLVHHLIDYFNILTPEAKQSISSARKLCHFDFTDTKHYNSLEKISVGFVGDKLIKEKLKQKSISDKDVMDLRRDCRGFITKLLHTLMLKSPINYSLVRNASCIDPRKMASEQENCRSSMKQILLNFCAKKIVIEEECDALLLQFKQFLDTTVSKYLASFKNFDPRTERLDIFLNNFLAQDASNGKLWSVMKILMVLSHGQATVERGFSVNKALEVENLKEDSYIAQRLIFENTNNANDIQSTIITKEMRKFVSSSRQKYMLHLEEQRKAENEKISENSRKRKIEELNYLKSKKAFLQADITRIEQSVEHLSNKAESSKSISLFIKSNELRREIKEKKSEIVGLESLIIQKEKEIN